jgi:hypothetical protein
MAARSFSSGVGEGEGFSPSRGVFPRIAAGPAGEGLVTATGAEGEGLAAGAAGLALGCTLAASCSAAADLSFPPQRLRAITMTRRKNAPAPIAIRRGLMEMGVRDGTAVSVDGVLETADVSLLGSDAGFATTWGAPQSGQAGRFTGS